MTIKRMEDYDRGRKHLGQGECCKICADVTNR